MIGQAARLGHQLRARHDAVDHPPARRFPGVDPAPGQQHLHRDMVGDAFGQLDGCCIRYRPRPDFRQRETGVIGSQDDVGAQRPFQPAPAADPVHCGNDRLVHRAHLLDAAKATDAVVAIHLVAIRRRLEIPTGAEELLARAGDDRHAQFGVIAKRAKRLAHDPAGLQIDCIGLGPVKRDFQHMAPPLGPDRVVRHVCSPILIKASAATAPFGVAINGLISTSSSRAACATT